MWFSLLFHISRYCVLLLLCRHISYEKNETPTTIWAQDTSPSTRASWPIRRMKTIRHVSWTSRKTWWLILCTSWAIRQASWPIRHASCPMHRASWPIRWIKTIDHASWPIFRASWTSMGRAHLLASYPIHHTSCSHPLGLMAHPPMKHLFKCAPRFPKSVPYIYLIHTRGNETKKI